MEHLGLLQQVIEPLTIFEFITSVPKTECFGFAADRPENL